MVATKICSKCKTEKSITEYSKDNRRKDGLHSICKQCKKQLYYTHESKNKFEQLKSFMKKVMLKSLDQGEEINKLKNIVAEILVEIRMNLPGPYQKKQKEYFDPSDPMNQ